MCEVKLDQRMYFLSTSTIPEGADAPGLAEARRQEGLREGRKEGIEEGRQEEKIAIARSLKAARCLNRDNRPNHHTDTRRNQKIIDYPNQRIAFQEIFLASSSWRAWTNSSGLSLPMMGDDTNNTPSTIFPSSLFIALCSGDEGNTAKIML